MHIVGLLAVGLLAGISAGMFGIGGGLIIVPALVFFYGLSQHAAVGTSLGALLLPVGALSAYVYWKNGNLNVGYSAAHRRWASSSAPTSARGSCSRSRTSRCGGCSPGS